MSWNEKPEPTPATEMQLICVVDTQEQGVVVYGHITDASVDREIPAAGAYEREMGDATGPRFEPVTTSTSPLHRRRGTGMWVR